METFQQISEEGRPPESPNKRYFNRKLLSGPSITGWSGNVPRRSYLGEGAVNLTNKNVPEFNNNVFDVVVHDLNRNVNSEKSGLKQTLPKLLCLKKPASCASAENGSNNNSFKTLNVNTLGTEHFPWNEYYDAQRSLHDSDDGRSNCGAEDLPSSSQETESSGKCEKRKSFHQNVEEALNSILWQPYEYQNTSRTTSISASSCTSPASSIDGLDEITKNDCCGIAPTRCTFTDLHPPPTSQMVINLPDSRVPLDQSGVPFSSRDQPAPRLSQVDAFSPTEPSSSSAIVCDEKSDGMQVNVSVATPDQGGVFSSELSLSSANVVGLPNHARYASVPVARSAVGSVLPNHARNVSEPTNHFMKQSNGGGGMVPPQPFPHQHHHRHSAQLEQSNFHQINHLRSSSVPKSMAMVPMRHENNTTATVPNNNNNNFRYNQKINYPSDVNVNFYRPAPVSVVSSVPTITCLNTFGNVHGNEVSNVQVLPLNSTFHNVNTTQVILHNSQPPGCNSIQIDRGSFDPQIVSVQSDRAAPPPPGSFPAATVTTTTTTTTTLNQVVVHNNSRPAGSTFPQRTYTNIQECPKPSARTFTSTEAQTDEVSVLPAPQGVETPSNREHRRRERRERRHQRRGAAGHQPNRLPDLLNSHHLPPPYSAQPAHMLPPPPPVPHATVLQSVVPNNVVPPSGFVFQAGPPPPPPPPPNVVPMVQVQGPAPVAVPVVPPPSGFRFPFPTNGFRRSRFTEDSPKGCCGLLSWKPGSLRWFIALIALVAVCCVLVGTALGAMRPAGRDHLTVSLLMIGVGIVLVTVSGVAWRLTSHDSSTCRSMLGLGSTESVDACARRFVPRLPPSYGRPHHPYAAMMYPEFQYRPPPPSYQASMQEYRLRLLLLDRGNTPQIQAGIQNAVSPPPTYRSHAGSLLRAPLSSRRDVSQSEYSCPPSYRSQNSTNRQGTLASNSVLHSREQSLSLSESNHGGSVVNVVNILGSTAEDIALDNITLDSLKMEPESDINPVKMLLKGSGSDLEGSKDGNLVTIVQTSDQSPVIVTVSGSSQINSNSSVQITEIPSEMEILAHL